MGVSSEFIYICDYIACDFYDALKRLDPVITVVAMDSAVGGDKQCVVARGVHGWISKR
jgi:hypothetical protein